MSLSAHEQSVRQAVAKVQAQSKLGAVQFRVDRAAREVEKAKGLLAKHRAEFDAANIALEAARAELGLAKKPARDEVASAAVLIPEAQVDPLAPIDVKETL